MWKNLTQKLEIQCIQKTFVQRYHVIFSIFHAKSVWDVHLNIPVSLASHSEKHGPLCFPMSHIKEWNINIFLDFSIKKYFPSAEENMLSFVRNYAMYSLNIPHG